MAKKSKVVFDEDMRLREMGNSIGLRKIGRMDYDNPKCPRCQSEDLEYGAYEPVDESFMQDISCNSCEADFVIYTLKPKYWEIWADEGFFHVDVKKE